MYHVTHRYAKANKKSKTENKYWYVNNLYG